MLKKIEVKGLFGTFNHPVTLKKENITLLLGENGLGKTIILKMVKCFFESNFYELQSHIFEEFNLTFSNNDVIKITKSERESKVRLSIELNVRRGKNPKRHIIHFDEANIHDRRSRRFEDSLYFREVSFILQRHLPSSIERIGGDRWLDHSRGSIYSTSELVEVYGKYLPIDLKKRLDKSLPHWLVDKATSLKIKLIETQRLLTKAKSEESAYHSSVVRYSQELIETIKTKTVAATDLASKLDRSYPNRIVNKITQKGKISDLELEEGLDKLNTRRELLNKVGLLDTNEENLIPITSAVKKQSGKNKELLKDVLQIYIDDSNEKLIIYDDLAQKINLLIEIINKRFLYKRISIDKKRGFVFTSTRTGKDIPLSGLSSGEQHELVLFFELLFNTESQSLLLIDEPEISLHISWQNQFINDLLEVIQLNNLSALIATHSPDIINNRWELTVQLKGE